MATTGATGSVLVFSDVHFDPFADPALVPALAAADVSQWKSLFAASGQTAFSAYGTDTDYSLFESALDSMARTAPGADLIIFPGDALAHGFWSKYPDLTGDASEAGLESFIQKTVTFFVGEVDSRFPDATVLWTIGNNDSANGDYKSAPGDAYFSLTAPAVAAAFLRHDADRAAFLTGYSQGGYYALEPDGPTGIKYVVLNDIYWSEKSEETAAGVMELAWFAGELADAARDFQKVWVVTHIPVGADAKSVADKVEAGDAAAYKGLLADGFNNAFVALETAYSATIAATFTGHTHRDEFRLVSFDAATAPTELASVSLSISPVDGNNPGYEIYAYDTASGALLDKTTYSLDLAAPGSGWSLEYDFAAVYGHGLATPGDWLHVAGGVMLDPVSQAAYANYYTAQADTEAAVSAQTLPVYWLAMTNATASGYAAASALLAAS